MSERDIQIIDCILSHEKEMSLKEVVEKTGLPQTAVHRRLASLVGEKMLHREKDKYSLGSVLLRWLNTKVGVNRYVDLIHPHLVEIAQSTGETIHLVQREGNIAFYLDKVEGLGSILLKSKINDRLKLYSTGAGRALMMLFDERDLTNYFAKEELVGWTEKTETDESNLRQALVEFKKRGYAYEIEQNEDHIQCIGVSFRFHHLDLAVSLTTTLLKNENDFHGLGKVLVKAVKKIESEIK